MASCQVKNSSEYSGLISGHVATTNKFTVTGPLAKTYIATEIMTFSVSFPFDIIMDMTSGAPRLRLTIGSTTRFANYSSVSGTKKINFTYTVQAGDNDANGIDVTGFELNGSTLTFSNLGLIENCDVSTVTAKNFPKVKIDTQGPIISQFAISNFPGLYNKGEKIFFKMAFSENVFVTGTPKFSVGLSSGGPVDALYTSGSGGTILTFTFVVTSEHIDPDGFDSITSPLILPPSTTIKDIFGNDALLNFEALIPDAITYSLGVKINGEYPHVVAITVPPNGTYVAAQDLDFIMQFDRPVNVTGIPYLSLVVGANTRQAQYLTGDGTEFITFRYTAIPGDIDSNGIEVAPSIAANGGTIVDKALTTVSYFTDPANNILVFPSTGKIILNAIQPMAISLMRNVDSTAPAWGGASTDNTWIIGQELNITVAFNTGIYVTQTNGSPTLPLTIGNTVRHASYLSGGNGQTSLVFRYVVQEGDLDTDGVIAIGNISLNNGVITDSANTNILLTLPVAGLDNTRVDAVKPLITSITAPTNGTYSLQNPLTVAQMSFTVNWSEAVNLDTTGTGSNYISMDIGGVAVNAEYVSGALSSQFVHRPLSIANRNDSDGITISSPVQGTAIIRDQAGNIATLKSFNPPVTSGILVDTTIPTITNISAVNTNGWYRAGNNIDFNVTFSEQVTTNVSGGFPQIPVIIGSTTRYLVPTMNTTNTIHTFRYTIVSGDLDTDGISVSGTITHNGTTAYARDGGRNNVSTNFTAPSTPGILVDAIPPTIIAVTRPLNGTYESPSTLTFTIQYSENVIVSGTPRIEVPIGLITANFNYVSGSGTNTLTFSYTLLSSDYDFDGLPSTLNSVSLNGGSIRDGGGNNAPLIFTTQNLSSLLVVYPTTDLWVNSSFTSLASAGNPSVTNAGVITTETCGTGICRIFNGDDALNLGAALNNVTTLFIVIKLPSTLSGGQNFDIFGTDVTIQSDVPGNNFDLNTANATVVINGITYSGVNHNTNFLPGSTHVIQVDFTNPRNYAIGALISTANRISIGEVIAVTGTLTAAQKANIYNYLDVKF